MISLFMFVNFIKIHNSAIDHLLLIYFLQKKKKSKISHWPFINLFIFLNLIRNIWKAPIDTDRIFRVSNVPRSDDIIGIFIKWLAFLAHVHAFTASDCVNSADRKQDKHWCLKTSTFAALQALLFKKTHKSSWRFKVVLDRRPLLSGQEWVRCLNLERKKCLTATASHELNQNAC